MSNTLTFGTMTEHDLRVMTTLAGWYAGHVFGPRVTVELVFTDTPSPEDDRVIALHYEVLDGYFLMGTVSWHIDCPTNGGWVAGGTSIDLDEV